MVWLILWLSLMASFSAQAAEKIRITNGEWPPYLSQQLPHYGLASRIITTAFALEGIEVEYGFFPWSRAIYLAELGAWQGTAVWRSTPEREQRFYLSAPVITSHYVFFHLTSAPFDWQGFPDLKPYRIGATHAYDYGIQFTAMEQEGTLQVERVTSDEQNFQRLLHGRIDLFPNDFSVGYEQISKLSLPERSRITHHPRTFEGSDLHLMLPRTDPDNKILITRFNRGLKKLKESGAIEQWQLELQHLSPNFH
jgi:polar amino acid transport system substrate-binding protein